LVPIYRNISRGVTRYTVAFYTGPIRVRRTFGTLEAAIEEAELAATKIHGGLSVTNDLRPHEREVYLAAVRIVQELGIPLVAAVEEYAMCRRLLGSRPLLASVEEFAHRMDELKSDATVPEVVEEFLKQKKRDGVSEAYQQQLTSELRRFAIAFPGRILRIRRGDIYSWSRMGKASPVTQNDRLRCVKSLFSYAKLRSYLPSAEQTEAQFVPLLKVHAIKTEIFQPEQLEKILMAAPRHVIPILAIGGFAGLRAIEVERLDWSAVDLQRRIIILQADQAKTAARRIVPISDNLAR